MRFEIRTCAYVTGCAVAATLAAAAAARAETIYGMVSTTTGDSDAPGVTLVSFDSAAPATVATVGNFSGVIANHFVRGMDFRPANGQLYVLSGNATGSEVQLYTCSVSTAALTPVGGPLTLPTTSARSASYSIDFNPVADLLRVVTRAQGNNNFRINPNTGALVAQDTNLAYAAGDVNFGNQYDVKGIAYSNNVVGGGTTTLYAWDYGFDSLVRIGGVNGSPSPNGGQMSTVGSLPSVFLSTSSGIGFDIGGVNGFAYTTHDSPSTRPNFSLYSRNLSTGAETSLGSFPAGLLVTDIAVVVPEPAAAAVLGLAVLGCGVRRRR
jgi:hypothetical protein